MYTVYSCIVYTAVALDSTIIFKIVYSFRINSYFILFYFILLLFLFHRILQFHRYFVLYMYTVVQSEVSGISGSLAMPQRIWRHTGRTLRSITQLRGFCLIFLAPGR
jgi:hypothetical protein